MQMCMWLFDSDTVSFDRMTALSSRVTLGCRVCVNNPSDNFKRFVYVL